MNSFKKLSYRLEIGLLIHKYPYVIILCIMTTPINKLFLPPKFPVPDREFRSENDHIMRGGLLHALASLLFTIPLSAYSGSWQEADNNNELEERRQEHVAMLAAIEEKKPVNEVASNQFNSDLAVLESVLKKASSDLSPETIDSFKEGLITYYNTGQLNDLEKSIKKLEQTEVTYLGEGILSLLFFVVALEHGKRFAEHEYPYILTHMEKLRKNLIDALKNLAGSNADQISLPDLQRVIKPYVNSIKDLKSYDTDFTDRIVENFRELFKKLLDMQEIDLFRAFINLLGEDGMTAFGLNEKPYLKNLIDENSDRKSKLELLKLIDKNS
jgi:hypothetical protein